jgi:hypothetical protein
MYFSHNEIDSKTKLKTKRYTRRTHNMTGTIIKRLPEISKKNRNIKGANRMNQIDATLAAAMKNTLYASIRPRNAI